MCHRSSLWLLALGLSVFERSVAKVMKRCGFQTQEVARDQADATCHETNALALVPLV